ncbi:hypothetical protein FRC02_011747 [Tulasnella sp. 418]|nr:hypothetical protein FRC02_011747 [Tulasnella sp. 418]
MDIFGTIGTSIDLALKIKSNCEQIGQNKDDGATLSSDIADSLAQIREFLERQPLSVPSELRDNLSEFENELMRILGRQQRLNKSSRNIVFTKFKEFYNADDVKNQLAELRLRIQICYQKLQLSSTIRTETNVSVISEHVVAIRQDQEATERKIHMILNALLPGGSDPNRNTLPAHSETISPVSAEVSPSSDLSHQNMQITRQIDSVPSMGNEKSTVLPAIEIERNYLKEKIKELANNIPSIRNQTMKQQTLSWLNPFREVAIWERDYTSSRTEEESIAETVRILRILRSEKRIAHADVAKELLYLASVLSKLGMWEEASIIYDRGIQICCELVKEGGAKVVMSLAGFILKTFSETAVHSKTADASGILDYIGTLRHQLKEQGQRDYLSKLALSLTNTSHEISHRGRFEASIKAEHEAILIYRYLTKANRYTHLPDLASSLHDLALDLSKLDRREDAINAVEEAVTLRQQLAARDPKIYLPGLIDSVRMLAVEVNNRGRYEDAVKIAKDGLENLQKLGDRSGRSDVPELISSMNSLLIELHYTKSEGGKQEGTKLGVVPLTYPKS